MPRFMMILTTLAFVSFFVAACNSGSATVPNCQGSGPGSVSATCSSCLTSKCEAEVSSVDSDCSVVASCIEACSCSDQACLTGCAGKADATCQTALGKLTSCQSQSCATQCGP